MQAARVSWSSYYCIQSLLREREGGSGGREVQGDSSRGDDSQLPAVQMQRKTCTNTRSHTVLSHKVQPGPDVLTLHAP